MRRKFTYFLLSAFLLVGSGQAMADRHDNGGKARQEQRNNHRPGNGGNPSGNKNHNGSGNKNHNAGGKNHNGGNKNHFGNDKKHDNKHHNDKHFGKPGNHGHPGNQGKPGNQGRPGGGHNAYRPGNGHHHGAPVPPPPPAPVMRPGAGAGFHPGPAMPPPPPPRLPHMVNYATRGCHDVAVWQVDAVTFLVKYRRGGRWYTRYVYPYAEEYGAPTLISVNWQPMSPWTLIPPIQLNINL